MSKQYVNLGDAVDDLAPPPPPCFLNSRRWVEYLKSAAASQNQRGEQKVILIVDGQPSFNKGMNFCVDCEDSRVKAGMQALDRCKPNHLVAA